MGRNGEKKTPEYETSEKSNSEFEQEEKYVFTYLNVYMFKHFTISLTHDQISSVDHKAPPNDKTTLWENE